MLYYLTCNPPLLYMHPFWQFKFACQPYTTSHNFSQMTKFTGLSCKIQLLCYIQRVFARTWYSNPTGHGNSYLGLDPIREKLVIQFWERGGGGFKLFNIISTIELFVHQILWTHLSEKTKFEKEQFNLTTVLKIIHGGGVWCNQRNEVTTYFEKELHNLTWFYKLVRPLQ